MTDKGKLKEQIHEVLWKIGGDTGWLDVRLEEVEKPIMDILDESVEQDRPIGQAKILQKPRECRNKNCVAMCSPAWAEFWFDKPNCPNYVRGEDRPIWQ